MFKVGDKVYSTHFGHGEVKVINKQDDMFPVIAKFYTLYRRFKFTSDGKFVYGGSEDDIRNIKKVEAPNVQ